MPIYEYRCEACGRQHEALQKVSDKPLRACPSCGKRALKRLMSAPRFRLKGAGWYETDFKSDKETKRNLAESGGEAAPAPAPAGGGDGAGASSGEKAGDKAGEKKADKSESGEKPGGQVATKTSARAGAGRTAARKSLGARRLPGARKRSRRGKT